MSDRPDRHVPVPVPPGTLGHVRQNAVEAEQLAALERLHPAELAALRESGLQGPYGDAIQSVCLHCSISPSAPQIRAIMLRLHAAGVSAKRARKIAEVLIDSPEFDDKVKRFRGEMTPADWLRVNELIPVKGRHYSQREVDEMCAVLRISPDLFKRVTSDPDDRRPFAFVTQPKGQ